MEEGGKHKGQEGKLEQGVGVTQKEMKWNRRSEKREKRKGQRKRERQGRGVKGRKGRRGIQEREGRGGKIKEEWKRKEGKR